MRELIMDGESGIAASARAGSFLSRLGIEFIPRAPQQHARIVERRGALFRDVVHRIDAQLKIDGLLDIPFGYRVAGAVFAGNALVTVNNTTPDFALVLWFALLVNMPCLSISQKR